MKKTFFSQCCRVISVGTLILGIIATVWIAFEFGTESIYQLEELEVKNYDLFKVICILLLGGVCSFASFTLWGTVAEHLERMAWITDRMSYEKTKENE